MNDISKKNKMIEVELKNEDDVVLYYIKGTKVSHRDDGPAIEYTNGDKVWYQHGKRHRLDGPAVEWDNGNKEFWVDGKYLSQEEFDRKIKKSKMEKNIQLLIGFHSEVVGLKDSDTLSLNANGGTINFYSGTITVSFNKDKTFAVSSRGTLKTLEELEAYGRALEFIKAFNLTENSK